MSWLKDLYIRLWSWWHGETQSTIRLDARAPEDDNLDATDVLQCRESYGAAIEAGHLAAEFRLPSKTFEGKTAASLIGIWRDQLYENPDLFYRSGDEIWRSAAKVPPGVDLDRVVITSRFWVENEIAQGLINEYGEGK